MEEHTKKKIEAVSHASNNETEHSATHFPSTLVMAK